MTFYDATFGNFAQYFRVSPAKGEIKVEIRVQKLVNSIELFHPAVLRHLDLSYYRQSSDERYLDVALSYANNVVSLSSAEGV